MKTDKHFVFLQGMPSGFFSKIAHELSARGCRVTGFNFCTGDLIFWRGPATVNYRGSFANWPDFIADYFDKNKVTDLVVLGDQRGYHKQAVEAALKSGVRVSVTDFGYLRPDWLTLERDGKSANSRFPKDAEGVFKLAATLPKADLGRRYADSFWKMARGDLLYSFSNVFCGWPYPRYRPSDERAHPLVYFPAMGWRLLRAKGHKRSGDKKMQALLEKKPRYFVFPLQLDHDYQIIAYSPFENLGEGIRTVLESFAAHAESGTRLLVKVHPWDPCLKNWKKLVMRLARDLGIEDRVDYFDGGDLDAMIMGAAGMITVNSTSGIRALQLGCPVKTLGDAIYDMPGLTSQNALDDYWGDARPPDPALVDALINAMAATIQIRGGFFIEPGMSAAAHAAAERLYNETVGLAGIPAGDETEGLKTAS